MSILALRPRRSRHIVSLVSALMVYAATAQVGVSARHHADHEGSATSERPDPQRLLCISETASRRYEAAIRACDLAIDADPGRAEVYSNRGVARLMLGDATRAVGDFTSAIDRAAENPLHYFNRALAEEQLNELKAALADYSAAIARAPGLAIAFNNRGFVYERIGDRQAAIADYARAVAIDPGLIVASRNLSRLDR